MQRPRWGIFLQMILGVMALLLVLEEIKLASLKKKINLIAASAGLGIAGLIMLPSVW
jgi:hypothetical protein